MKRFIIATLVALSAFGCGDTPVATVQQGTIGFPARRGPELSPGQCSQPGEIEAQYADKKGYDPSGCLRSDRMANVSPWTEEEDPDIGSGKAVGPEIGQAEQPITVASGSDASVSVTIKNGKIDKTQGSCKTKASWTTAEPLTDSCLIPEVVGGLDWSVCPSCYDAANRNYIRDRMKEAWAGWKRSVTCGGVTRSNVLKSAASSERTASASAEENYDNARIPIFPVNDTFETSYAARAMVDVDFVTARTPVRQGVRFYSWSYAGIALNHHLIEGFKLEACTDPGESSTSVNRKLKNAYDWILAHEMGHLLGFPHRAFGLMRKSADTTCAEVYSSAATPPSNTAADAVELSIVSQLADSSGFSLATLPSSQACGVGVPIAPHVAVDDIFIGQLF